MSFAWPLALGLLVLAPLLVLAYVRLVRRRARRTAELAAQGFAPNEAAVRTRRRRHVPFALFLAGLTLLLFSLARPQADVRVPEREGTVILALDVSSSMRAADLKPTRLAASKAAAAAFIDRQPSEVRIGVVAFSDGSLVIQPPTKDRDTVKAAVKRLTPQGSTSLAQGIFASLKLIAGKPIVLPKQTAGADDAEGLDVDKVEIGFYGSAVVVLLSDGENTGRRDPRQMAELASVAGVKVYPVGMGTREGAAVEIDGFSVATALDEKSLQDIAAVTDGKYFRASDAGALSGVYDQIDLEWRTRTERTEVTGVVAGIAAALFVLGGALSLLWFGRVV
jgi:Ca-activated chloride channel homolog